MTAPRSGPTDLRGQVALVTGAARGIGRAASLALARAGATVVAADVQSCAETTAAIAAAGGRSEAAACDVKDAGQVERLVTGVADRLGRLDIVVNAAGVRGPLGKPGDWEQVIGTNLTAAYRLTLTVLPIMERQGYGKIVYVGSLGAQAGGLVVGPAYVAAKGGIHGLVKWVAKDGAAKGIYANVVSPGMTRTAMTEGAELPAERFPLGRIGEPEDIAEAILFLASQASNYITGTVLDVNGGMRFN